MHYDSNTNARLSAVGPDKLVTTVIGTVTTNRYAFRCFQWHPSFCVLEYLVWHLKSHCFYCVLPNDFIYETTSSKDFHLLYMFTTLFDLIARMYNLQVIITISNCSCCKPRTSKVITRKCIPQVQVTDFYICILLSYPIWFSYAYVLVAGFFPIHSRKLCD